MTRGIEERTWRTEIFERLYSQFFDERNIRVKQLFNTMRKSQDYVSKI